ncbi:MAG: hypothetical protein P8J55_06990 [Pseudomonadales bacterium]|nr:hypothetical protein [Pseudomonadales bacterium]
MPLDLVVSKKGNAPFDVELVVFEEDTFRLLSASNFVQEMAAFKPEHPGEILVKGNHAYAIVHDLDQDPTCRSESVDMAIRELLAYCNDNDIEAVATEPLGCVHGKGNVDDFVAQLKLLASDGSLRRLWVMS